jgi:hypothetical protein
MIDIAQASFPWLGRCAAPRRTDCRRRHSIASGDRQGELGTSIAARAAASRTADASEGRAILASASAYALATAAPMIEVLELDETMPSDADLASNDDAIGRWMRRA